MSSCVRKILFKSEQICGCCCKMLRGSLFWDTRRYAVFSSAVRLSENNGRNADSVTNECTYTQQLDTGLHAAAGSTVPGGQAGATVPGQKVRSACEIRDTERRDVGVAGCNYRIQTALLVRARRRSVYIYEYYGGGVA